MLLLLLCCDGGGEKITGPTARVGQQGVEYVSLLMLYTGVTDSECA